MLHFLPIDMFHMFKNCFCNAYTYTRGTLLKTRSIVSTEEYFNRLGFDILSRSWFVYNLNGVAVKCDNDDKLQVLYFSSLVVGKFLDHKFNDHSVVSLQKFSNKWL